MIVLDKYRNYRYNSLAAKMLTLGMSCCVCCVRCERFIAQDIVKIYVGHNIW